MHIYIFFSNTQQLLMGQGLLIIDVHFYNQPYTPHVVRLLWSSGQADAVVSHNTHKRQTSMPSAGFETTIPASERPQVHALDRAAAGIGVA
jgi:hypothetical protein